MKHFRFQKNYAKVYALIAVLIMSIGIILSTALYYNFKSTTTKVIQSYTKDQLSLIKYSTKLMFDNAAYTLMQYNTNPAALKLLNYANMDQIEISTVQRQLQAVNINMPTQQNIYIYNRAANAFYYNRLVYKPEEFPDQGIVKLIQKGGEELPKLSPIPRSIPSYNNFRMDTSQLSNVYTFVYYDGNPDVIQNAIILNLSNDWLNDTIKSMDTDISKEMIVTDTFGQVILGNDRYQFGEQISDNFHELFDTGNESNETSGYKISRVDGEKVLVSYATSDLIGWKYIRITPYDLITNQIKNELVTTSLIVLGVILLFLLIAYLMTNNIFRIFVRYMNDLEKKLAFWKPNSYEARQTFLRKLTIDRHQSEKTQSQLDDYGIPFRLEDSFELLLLHIDTYGKSGSVYSVRDKDLLIYGLINLINETTAGTRFRGEAFVLSDSYAAVLLNGEFNDFEESTTIIADLINEILDRADHYLALKLSIVIGDILEDLAEIPPSLTECMDAMSYRMFYAPRPVLYLSRIREMNKQEYKISKPAIEQLSSQLCLGKREEFKVLLHELLESSRAMPFSYLQMTILQIAVSLKGMLDRMNGFSSMVKLDDFFELAQRLSQFESLDVLEEELLQIGDRIASEIDQIQDKKSEKYSQRIMEIIELVDLEFSNSNLNPDEIAGRFDISAEYLRKLFKSATGESLGEHINKVRLDHAKRMLLDTNDPIQEITSRTGFTNANYFYSLFKKHCGVTPSEYRNLNG